MRPFHVNNLQLQPYSPFRVVVLAWVAKLLGVQFKIDGIPFGGRAYPHPVDPVDERPRYARAR